ncbi:MAG: glycosyltransferase family 9 protein [Betaproteobacteria bacterium]
MIPAIDAAAEPPRAIARSRSRLQGRAAVVARTLADRLRRRRAPRDPRRILVAHHLLLGDTLMLTPLIAKLRERYPAADIVMTVADAVAPLYATRPYGVRAIGWNPAALSPVLFAEAPFDLAFVPGDNRYAWLAAAMRARWIVAFGGAASMRRDWPVDQFVAYRTTPGAWGDLCAELVDGAPPAPYDPAAWPAPPAAPFTLPRAPYAVLHVGASTPLKQWEPARIAQVAQWLVDRGVAPVWSGGHGEEAIVRAIDPESLHASYAGTLDLAQMWHLVAGARALVAPDTGIAHLGRIVGTPTVSLFGPGSATICGAGDFWRASRYRAVTVDPFPCRDQRILFRRDIAWVRRCGRSTAQCPHPRCMDAIDVDSVIAAIGDVMR